MPRKNIIGLLYEKPRLLVAQFEINNVIYPVIIDTGATISVLPSDGAILSSKNVLTQSASLNIKLADNRIEHIDRKALLLIKPTGCNLKPVQASFYIQPSVKRVLEHEALIGLNCLRQFNLDIKSRNGMLTIWHNDKLIGKETAIIEDHEGSIRLDKRFDKTGLDTQISHILKRYKMVFTELDQHPIKGDPMRIITVHRRPIFSKQRHYNPEETIQMKQHVQTLLNSGIIEPTQSGYAATSRIIPKKNGTGRLVINYIPLNLVTLRDSYCVPHISDIIAAIRGNNYFTTMDCSQGFYQILIDPRDRHKTAFSTPIGNYQFKRCPFGARNSGAFFQSEMNRIFRDGLYTRCIIYVDDILVFGKTRQQHDENLTWVLSKCKEFHVKIKFEKCHFAKPEVEYLGFIIDGKSIRPVESKVDSICKTKPPRDKTQLKSLIGKLNFYSRFIPKYSSLLEPLRNLLRQNKDFQWREYHQQAYQNLVSALKASSRHLTPSTDEHKIVELHVLDDSVEIILLNQEERLIHRTSRLLSQSEANYSLTEKFLLALVLGINKFRIWLRPGKFKVRMPSKELEKTLKLIHRPERVDNMLLKLPEGFDSFEFEIKGLIATNKARRLTAHVPQEVYYVDGACRNNGKPNCKATWAVCAEFDRELEERGFVKINPSNQSAEVTAAVKACEIARLRNQDEITIVTDSRYLHSAATLWIDKWSSNDWKDHRNKPVVNKDLFMQLIDAKQGLQVEWIHVKGHNDNQGNIRADTLARGLLDDNQEVLCSISHHAKKLQDHPEVQKLKADVLDKSLPNFKVENDVLYYIDRKCESYYDRIYVPESCRDNLLHLAHDDPILGGHLGVKKTYRKLLRYWWPKMYKQIEDYIKSCDKCQRFKNVTGLPSGVLHNIPVSCIFEHVHIDIIGPIRSTCRGNSYIITATDAFSKWAFAQAYQSVTTTSVIEFMESFIICIYGKPKIVISDRGPQFTSKEWSKFVDRIGFKHQMTTPYHPQSNGIDERFNGTIIRILRTYVDEFQSDWDLKLKWALYAYNTTVHESTGYSPYQTLHGLDPRSPLRGVEGTNTELKELNIIREKIRIEVNNNISKAQDRNKDLYDRSHKPCQLKLGQLVLARQFTSPQDYSKKLYPNWYGPLVVIGFVGDPNSPRAVELLNVDQQTKKILAIRDIKPYFTRNDSHNYNNEDVTWSNEADETANFQSSGYYLDLDNDKPALTGQDGQTNNTFYVDHAENLNDCESMEIDYEPVSHDNQTFSVVDRRTSNQPVSSSPKKHVSINDVIRVREYPAIDSINNETIDESNTATTSDDTLHQESETGNKPSNGPSNIPSNKPSNEVATPETTQKSPYICDFIIDDPVKDPTYKHPVSNIPKSTIVTRLRSKTLPKNTSVPNKDNQVSKQSTSKHNTRDK